MGWGKLEFAVVISVVAVLAGVLLGRLQDTVKDSHRVELRMGAENARLQGLLFQLRCGSALEPSCWRSLLIAHNPASEPHGRLDPQNQLPALEPEPQGLLLAVAWAAGVAKPPRWVSQADGSERLQVALSGVSECRFVLTRVASTGQVLVIDVEDRC
jgi:type II secretory pathway pseudopilin PulG